MKHRQTWRVLGLKLVFVVLTFSVFPARGLCHKSAMHFYVAQTGSDANPGSLLAPWRTIQHAMNNATPGSTVLLRAGEYHERLTLNVSGSAGKYITFQPYGFNVPLTGCSGYTARTCDGERVILDYASLGTVRDTRPLVWISNRHYVRVQGLVFQNFTCDGAMQQGIRIDANSSHINFNHNTFLNDRNVHPLFDQTAALLFFRIWRSNEVTVDNNEFGKIVTVMSEVLTVSDGATNTLIKDNYVHDTDGIAISSWSGANHFAFVGNRTEYIGIRRDGTVWYDKPPVAIYDDGGFSGIIAGNVVSHSGVGYEALSEPGQPRTHDIAISHNIAEHCVSSGIVIGTWYSETDGSSVYDVSITNNDFYRNRVGVLIRPMMSNTVVWKNNIIADNETNYDNPLHWKAGDAGSNLYYGSNVGPGTKNVIGKPLFLDAEGDDFRLQPRSPAIGAGDALVAQRADTFLTEGSYARVRAGAIDIGTFSEVAGSAAR